MIVLHNLHGEPIAINGGLIERVEGGTETHVTLTSGTSYIVGESLEDVVRFQREDRAEVQAEAIRRLSGDESSEQHSGQRATNEAALRLLPVIDDEGDDAR